jgi:methylated-DNA-[protein]-cysteine S-methyltransferase
MIATPTLLHDVVPSPLGDLLLTTDGERLVGLEFEGRPARGSVRDAQALREPVRQLRAYFAGELESFDLEFDQPGTDFQRRVWAELVAIPYGETISYAELARRIGQPQASRAVGGANGRNRIAIVVPCHRVIAADGTLGGYGGELWRKDFLLNLERR